MLLEKAYAKVYGCYDEIEGGTTSEALYALTGAPVEVLNTTKLTKEEMWKYIYGA